MFLTNHHHHCHPVVKCTWSISNWSLMILFATSKMEKYAVLILPAGAGSEKAFAGSFSPSLSSKYVLCLHVLSTILLVCKYLDKHQPSAHLCTVHFAIYQFTKIGFSFNLEKLQRSWSWYLTCWFSLLSTEQAHFKRSFQSSSVEPTEAFFPGWL